ncbi:MAG: metallophosphoesterase [Phycisphaerales bacterium]|nr:metallophosphoesterase [Phycisphaerales bacterium]
MSKRTNRMLAFSDVHFPHQNPKAVEVFCRAAERIKPDLIVCLGDLLDCGHFSTYPPTFGMPESDYFDDLRQANALLDRLQKVCGRLVMVEGNHEYRLDRWAAATAQGRGTYSMLAPRVQLTGRRKNFTYVRYGTVSGTYPHFAVSKRIVAVHGWSCARHATKQHLDISQGKSIIHGHTHRADACIVQGIWSSASGGVIESRSAGCLCKRIPLYGTGRPVEWVNAFILGYLGRRSDTLYTIPIMDNRCILPDGTEVAV